MKKKGLGNILLLLAVGVILYSLILHILVFLAIGAAIGLTAFILIKLL
jgi:hypothetical protein